MKIVNIIKNKIAKGKFIIFCVILHVYIF